MIESRVVTEVIARSPDVAVHCRGGKMTLSDQFVKLGPP